LIMGIENGTVYLWALGQDDLIELACRTAGRNISQADWARYSPGENYRITCPQWPEGE
jgi:hypothetical protein